MKENDQQILKNTYIGFKVIDVVRVKNKNIHLRRIAKCLCDCGKLFDCRTDFLDRKRGCTSCGHKYGGKNRILPAFEAAKRAYYTQYKGNAVSRSLEFSLSREQFDNIISKNCIYCGMSPQDQSYLSKSTKKYDKFYASGIDRLNNKLGYTLENCVPCCSKCNMMKKAMSCDEFLQHITSIFEYQKYNINNIIETNE